MNKRRLPLDSRDWTPFDVLHPLVCAQTGDRRFADRDLTYAMANGQVRSMRRRISPPADKPERELLPPSFWADYKLDSSWPVKARDGEKRVLVLERAPRLEPVVELPGLAPEMERWHVRLYGYVFYGWKPHCIKIFGLRAASEAAREPVREKLEKPGRPQTIQWQRLREEIMRRCWQNRRFIAPESLTSLTTDLRAWHKKMFKKEPNYDDLRKFVGDAIALLKLVGR